MKTAGSIKINISYQAIIDAFSQMKKEERDALLEDLLALASPEYVDSVREARADYHAGRVKKHDAIFGKK